MEGFGRETRAVTNRIIMTGMKSWKKNNRIFLGTLLLMLSLLSAPAQTGGRVRVQASAVVQIKKSKPSAAELATGQLEAKRAIIKTYLTQAAEERQKLLMPYQEKLLQDVDAFVTSVTVIAQQVDGKAKSLSVAVVGFVEVSTIDGLLPKDPGAKNYISLIFVSRRQSTVKSIGPEVATGVSNLSASKLDVSQEASGGTTSIAASEKTDSAVVTKSAVTVSSEKRLYEVATADSLDTAIEGVLSKRNFRVVPSATLRKRSNGAFSVEKFIETFKGGNDISGEVVETAAEACKAMKPQLPFYGYGTLTVEPPQKDPTSGRTRVNVQIYAKVIDCRGDFAETAASLGDVQYSGLGETATEAETVALTGAAKQAAQLLADQLNAKGIF